MRKVVDVGYGYVKWVGNEKDVQKRQAIVTRIESGSVGLRSENIDTITVDGVEYIIGRHEFGHLKAAAASNTRNRVEDLEYKVLFLYPFAVQAAGNDFETDVITGLPIQTVREEAPVLIEQFQDKEFNVVFRGAEFKISIGNVSVMPQGYATNLYLISTNPALKKEDILVVDIGFQTVNYVYVQKGGVFNDLVDTHPSLGIGSAYDEIAKLINRQTRSIKNYTKYDVDFVLDNGATIIEKNAQETKLYFNEDQEVLSIFDKHSLDIWEDIRMKYIDKRHPIDKVIFTGGSSERLKNYLKENSLRKTLFPDSPQDLQVLGYDMYARNMK